VTDLTIQPNAHVTLDYELRDDEGEMLEASAGDTGAPIRYIHGYGMLVPGLEAALVGLRTGDVRDVVVPADAGYGEYDEDLLLELDRAELPDPKGVRDIRAATDDEIHQAAAQLDEAHEHVHGPDCDHDHEPISIGKRNVN
jgi:hypothetical protein